MTLVQFYVILREQTTFLGISLTFTDLVSDGPMWFPRKPVVSSIQSSPI